METQCPACKEVVNESASKCSHCGTYIRGRRKWIARVVRVIEFISLLSVVGTLWFLYIANRTSQQALEDSRKASLEALARVDSSITLQGRALKVQEEQARTEQSQLLQKTKEFLENNKPEFDISPLSATQSDSGLDFGFAIKNHGPSAAKEVIVLIRSKSLFNSNHRFDTTWFFNEFLPQKASKFPITLLDWKGTDFVWYIEVRYKWPAMSYEGSNRTSFMAYYRKSDKKFEVGILDDNDHKKYWGQP